MWTKQRNMHTGKKNNIELNKIEKNKIEHTKRYRMHTTYRKNNNLEKCAGMGLNGFHIK